jgi:DNA-binding transcriptional LysR family regulator
VQLEIRHARVVVILAEVGSISKAAAQLGLPQPSLTAQLRRIEKAVGGTLFARSPTGITPTVLGARLVPMLADLVAHADAVLAEATFETGTLRFGIAEWTPTSLPEAIHRALPAFEVQTVTIDSAAGLADINRGRLDMALISNPELIAPMSAREPTLATAVVVREPIWLAVQKDDPFTDALGVPRSYLSSLPWVRHVPAHWLYEVEEIQFPEWRDFEPKVLHRVAGHAEAMSWVRDAGAVTLVTPTGSNRDVSLLVLDDAMHCELLLVWRAGAVEPDTVRTLVRTLRGYYCAYAKTVPTLWSRMRDHPAEFPELEEFLPQRPLSSSSDAH